MKIFLFSLMMCFIGSLLDNEAMAKEESQCMCAVMNGSDPNPLIEHTLYLKLDCEEDGKANCIKLCQAMAEVSRISGNGPKMLCKHLAHDADNMIINLQSKACNAPYQAIGIVHDKPVCCQNGEAKECLLEK